MMLRADVGLHFPRVCIVPCVEYIYYQTKSGIPWVSLKNSNPSH